MPNHVVSGLNHLCNKTCAVFLKEAKKSRSEVPGAAIADVQLQLYKQDHLFSNRNMGMSTDLADFQNGSVERKGINEQKKVLSELQLHY